MDPSTAARVVTAAACGVGGLAVGSFLNVVAHRLPRGMSVVRPGSHCPACGTELRALDNVPLVSWLALGGRCRTCRVAIPARYPLVELAGGAGFAGLAVAAGPGWALPPLLLAVAVAIAAAAVDAGPPAVRPPGPPGRPNPGSSAAWGPSPTPAVPGALLVAGVVAAVALVVVVATEGTPARIGWAALGALLAGAAAWATDRLGRRAPRPGVGSVPGAAAASGTEPAGRAARRTRADGAGGDAAPSDVDLTGWRRRAGMVALLGWAAGWCWPPGGPLVAAWALAAWAVWAGWTARAVGRWLPARAAAPGPAAPPAAGPADADTQDSGTGRPGGGRGTVPLWAVAAGAYGVLLAATMLGLPR